MSWASQKQFKYILGVTIFFSLIIFALAYPHIFKDPTCSDNKKNGDEQGIDCGGSCMYLCKANLAEPAVVWSRAFPVIGNVYNLVSYVENPNTEAAIENISYIFKVYDNNNTMISSREGVTYIPPNKQFVIFEPRFDSGGRTIKSVSFEFTSSYAWVKKDSNINTLPVIVDNIIYNKSVDDKHGPSLDAIVNNDSIYDIPKFDVIAILYDINHNAVNVSKTVINGLISNQSAPLYFTWPIKFSGDPVVNDILVQINPFTISF